MSIYIASKTKHAAKWRMLRDAGFPIVSTWIDEAEPGATTDGCSLAVRCIQEAGAAAVLICYREPGEVLQGALVEIGAAIAGGRPVLMVGHCDQSATIFDHHPQVLSFRTLADALVWAWPEGARARRGQEQTA